MLKEAKELFFDIHGPLHDSIVSGCNGKTIANLLLEDLQPDEYKVMPTKDDETIAWVMWHLARIEDLTMNVLVKQGEQIFNEQLQEKLKVRVKDTGNAWSDEEIIEFSKSVNIKELLEYRKTVGIRTREIVKSLSADDMKRKVLKQDLQRILQEGGVTEKDDSKWLLDYWGKKDIAGLLLMPPTRHVTLHLNDCFKWKAIIRSRKV